MTMRCSLLGLMTKLVIQYTGLRLQWTLARMVRRCGLRRSKLTIELLLRKSLRNSLKTTTEDDLHYRSGCDWAPMATVTMVGQSDRMRHYTEKFQKSEQRSSVAILCCTVWYTPHRTEQRESQHEGKSSKPCGPIFKVARID